MANPWNPPIDKPARAGVYPARILISRRFGQWITGYAHWDGSRWGEIADEEKDAKPFAQCNGVVQSKEWRMPEKASA